MSVVRDIYLRLYANGDVRPGTFQHKPLEWFGDVPVGEPLVTITCNWTDQPDTVCHPPTQDMPPRVPTL